MIPIPAYDMASIFVDDGFLPVLTPEIMACNRKRCRAIVDRLRGNEPAIGSPLGTDWIVFTPEESKMLKGKWKKKEEKKEEEKEKKKKNKEMKKMKKKEKKKEEEEDKKTKKKKKKRKRMITILFLL